MESKKINYKYILVVIGALTFMVAYSTGSTALSFFVEPVSKEFGYARSAFTLSFSLLSLAGVFSMPVIGRLIKRFGVRKINLISGIFCTIGLAGFSQCNSLISFYFTAAFFGFFKPAAVLGGTVLADSWFQEKKGTVLGIIMAGSGLGGVIVGVLVPWFISISDWRRAFLFLAAFELILTAINILLIKDTPQSVGLKKYGEAKKEDINAPVYELTGVPYKDALKMPQFYLLYIASVVVSLVASFLQHMAAFYTGLGLSSIQAGSLVSILMLCLTIVKIFIGALNDKLGIRKVSATIHLSFFCGFVLLLLPGANYAMLVFASVLLSFGYSSILLFSPLITREVFGERDYSGIFGIMGTAVLVGTSLGIPAWGMIYDVTKSYNLGIIISAALILIVVFIYSFALKTNKVDKSSN